MVTELREETLGLWMWHQLTPPPALSVAEWAEQHRIVSANGERWDNSRTPYLVEPMNCMADPSIEVLVLMLGSQIGKTEAVYNGIGWLIDNEPGDMLYVRESQSLLEERVMKGRLKGLVEFSPRVAQHRIAAKGAETARLIKLATMTIFGGWAGSESSLASESCSYVVLDELDKIRNVTRGKESIDPEKAAERRTKAKVRKLIVKMCTPTYASGRIARAYRACGDRRRWWAPCPDCGTWREWTFAELRWPAKPEGMDPVAWASRVKGDELAALRCPACAGGESKSRKSKVDSDSPQRTQRAQRKTEPRRHQDTWDKQWGERVVSSMHRLMLMLGVSDPKFGVGPGWIDERARRRMMAGGMWCPEGCRIEGGKIIGEIPESASRGYRGGGLMSLLPGNELGRLAAEFLVANDPRNPVRAGALREFFNQAMGEESREAVSSRDETKLRRHCTALPEGVVPHWAQLLVAGADLQAGSIYFVIRAFGFERRSQLVRAFQCTPVGTESDWEMMARELWRPYPVEGDASRAMGVHVCLMDSQGFRKKHGRTGQMYAVAMREPRLVPIKGQQRMDTPWKMSRVMQGEGTAARETGLKLYHLHVSHWKDELAALIELPLGGPGEWLLHAGVSSDYLQHLGSEAKDPETGEWVEVSKLNHFWDCEGYALAAAGMTGILARGAHGELLAFQKQGPEGRDQGSGERDGGDWLRGRGSRWDVRGFHA